MHIFTEDLHKFIISGIDIHKGHVNSWNHYVSGGRVTEIEYIIDHLFFFVFNNALFLTDINEGTQLMFCHGICFCIRIDMEQ